MGLLCGASQDLHHCQGGPPGGEDLRADAIFQILSTRYESFSPELHIHRSLFKAFVYGIPFCQALVGREIYVCIKGASDIYTVQGMLSIYLLHTHTRTHIQCAVACTHTKYTGFRWTEGAGTQCLQSRTILDFYSLEHKVLLYSFGFLKTFVGHRTSPDFPTSFCLPHSGTNAFETRLL